MKKTFLFGLMAVILAGFGFVGVSLADSVASLGGNEYATLQEAINGASDGATITLLSNITLSSQLLIPEGKNVILDIGTFDIKAGNSTGNNILVEGSLTLTGTSGKIYSEDNYNSSHRTCIIVAKNGGDFIMNGGNIYAVINSDPVNLGQYGVCVYGEGSSVEINGGEITAGWYAISGNGSDGNDGTTVTINGGRLISVGDYAIYNPQNGNVIINEGAFIQGGAGAVAIFDGNLVVNGGTLTSIGDGITGDRGDGTSLRGNETLIIGTSRGGYGNASVVISGGNISADNGTPVINLDDTQYNVSCEIIGGTFSSDPSDYIDTGYTVLKKSDNEYVVMLLADAATDASNTENIQLPEGVTVNTGAGDVVMDLSNDITNYLSGAIKTGEDVSVSTGELTGEIQGVGYTGVVVAGTVLLDFGGTANFSRPVAIRIPVSGTSSVKVKVKHGTDAYGYTGLTLNPDATCNADGSVASSTYAGTNIPVNGGFAVIYTCSASTFVAYTETAISTPSYGGGSSSTSYSCKNLPENAVANNSSRPSKSTDYSYSTDTGAVCTFQCKDGYTWNADKKTCDEADETVDTETEEETEDTNTNLDPKEVLANGFTREFNDAYEFAFANGITTMKTIQEAAMEDGLNRIAMAKMLSQYAINVLKKTPDTNKECKFGDVSAELDEQYDNGVTLACQLGIMGVGITDFRPFDPVVRAEFGTALSRLLFGLEDGEDKYYTTHLAKLKEAGIISNDDPTLEELRGYVMLMLMRSAK